MVRCSFKWEKTGDKHTHECDEPDKTHIERFNHLCKCGAIYDQEHCGALMPQPASANIAEKYRCTLKPGHYGNHAHFIRFESGHLGGEKLFATWPRSGENEMNQCGHGWLVKLEERCKIHGGAHQCKERDGHTTIHLCECGAKQFKTVPDFPGFPPFPEMPNIDAMIKGGFQTLIKSALELPDRRERIATQLMTGLLASHDRGNHGRVFDFDNYADDACSAADSLMKVLDK